MYGDMPPLVDQPSFMSPPMGASNGGRPGDGGLLAAFPGASRSAGPTSPYWPAQGTPFPSSAGGPAGWPTTPTTPHTYNAAYPTSATSWNFGGAQPAPPTRGGYVPWVGGQAPSESSPGGSWGPRTPGEGAASGWGAYSPWSAPAASGGGAGWGPPAGSGGGGAGWGTPGGGSGGWGTPAGGSGGWGTPGSAGAGWGPTLPGTAAYESASGQPITAGYFGGGDVDAHGFPVRLGRSHSKKERRKSQSRHRRNSSSHGHARFDLAFGDDDSDSDWTHVHHHDSAFGQALRRSNSHSAAAAKHRLPRISPHHTPEHVHRSLSWGNEPTRDPFFSPPAQASGSAWDPYTISAYQLAGAQANLPAYLKGDVYDENNLAKRPRDWRADYVPRQSLGSGLATFVLGKGRSDVRGEYPYFF
ncbi:hypothetical protein BJ165DRAFT_932394 [Panaeolus papilionaceus]|nr:hypothetical protein BJ165DRAFT_932394 [Panaeolus papilionaceus]